VELTVGGLLEWRSVVGAFDWLTVSVDGSLLSVEEEDLSVLLPRNVNPSLS
jgi:hypothetical protein